MLLHVLDRVGALLVDGQQQAHHAFIGAAVERALQRADGAGDGGVDVGEGGCDDAGRKGGGVQLVLGVQNQRQVHGRVGGLGGLFAVQHPQEIGRVGEGPIRRNNSLPLRMRS